MGNVPDWDKQYYIEAAGLIPMPLEEYNRVLQQLIQLNGLVSLTELSCTYRCTRSIRGAAFATSMLQRLGFIEWDKAALHSSHRSCPQVYTIHYDHIEREALEPTFAFTKYTLLTHIRIQQ